EIREAVKTLQDGISAELQANKIKLEEGLISEEQYQKTFDSIKNSYEPALREMGEALGMSADEIDAFVDYGMKSFDMADFELDRKSTRLNSSHVSISYA